MTELVHGSGKSDAADSPRQYPSPVSRQPASKRYLLRNLSSFARPIVLGILPVPDLIDRRQVRRAAKRLVRCDPWPGMAATGMDAAQLALLRLLFLQRETRRAVRTRQSEAATVLARAAIDTLITGLYCLHEPEAVAQLQQENVRQLPLILEWMEPAGIIPADVLAECIGRLRRALGDPARGPSAESMAKHIDKATDSKVMIDLYRRFYRPASNFTVHAGAASLLRHVRDDDRLRRRPVRTSARRTPARIGDACLGVLTAAVAQRAGIDYQQAAGYADKHHARALTPIVVMSAGGLSRSFAPREFARTIRRVATLYGHARAGGTAAERAGRTANIRELMEGFLLTAAPDVPDGALDPFLDYVAAKIANADDSD
jgi:hypothetical protein